MRRVQHKRFVFSDSDKVDIYIRYIGYLLHVDLREKENIEPAVPTFEGRSARPILALETCAVLTGAGYEPHRLNTIK